MLSTRTQRPPTAPPVAVSGGMWAPALRQVSLSRRQSRRISVLPYEPADSFQSVPYVPELARHLLFHVREPGVRPMMKTQIAELDGQSTLQVEGRVARAAGMQTLEQAGNY